MVIVRVLAKNIGLNCPVERQLRVKRY